MENRVLETLSWDADEGRLAFQGVRYLLIRPETLAAFQKGVEGALGEPAAEFLHAGGFAGGSASARRYQDAFGHSDEETARFLCRMGGQIGWGRFDLVEFDRAQSRMVVEVRSSPFAEAYGRSDAPVCHFIRGVLAGVAAGVLAPGLASRETECAACGAPRCRFEVARP